MALASLLSYITEGLESILLPPYDFNSIFVAMFPTLESFYLKDVNRIYARSKVVANKGY